MKERKKETKERQKEINRERKKRNGSTSLIKMACANTATHAKLKHTKHT